MSSKEIESKLHSAVTYLKLPSDGYLRLTNIVDMTWVKDEEPPVPPVPPGPIIPPDDPSLPSMMQQWSTWAFSGNHLMGESDSSINGANFAVYSDPEHNQLLGWTGNGLEGSYSGYYNSDMSRYEMAVEGTEYFTQPLYIIAWNEGYNNYYRTLGE